MDALVSVDHALRAVLTMARVTPGEAVRLGDAVGRTLAESVASREPHPPFDASAMDGVALRVADLPDSLTLPLVGAVHAGDAPGDVPPGVAVAIMTGAPVPSGADAVVPVERITRDGDTIRLDARPEVGQHIRTMGDALAAGVEVLAAGTVVTPGAIAVLAAVGADPVWVHSRPCVAVIATGDELVDAASPLSPGQIRDSNGPTLAAMAEAAEATVLGPLRARDTVADLDRVLDTAGDADVIVFAGGVSMGERDGVRDAVEARGGSWTLWGVRQRPGKPLAVGVLDGRPVLGLPGNPVSAAVCFEVYVRPLLAAMLGRPADAVTEAAVLDAPISKKVGLRTFARVTVRRDADGRLHAFPAGAQGSHVAHSLALADGLAHLPADWDAAPAGATVAFQRWGGPSG